MKREDLTKIDGLTDAQVDAVMALHGQDATAWNAARAALTQERDAARQERDTAVSDRDAARQKLTEQQDEYQFATDLNDAIRDAGAISVADARTLLPGQDALRKSANRKADILAAVAAQREAKPYLYRAKQPEDPVEPVRPSGVIVPKPTGSPVGGDPTFKDFLSMTGAQRLELHKNNPTLFAAYSTKLRQAR